MKELEGKEVLVFYNDTPEHVTAAIGVLTNITNEFYILDEKTMIPKEKVIRIEIKKKEKKEGMKQNDS